MANLTMDIAYRLTAEDINKVNREFASFADKFGDKFGKELDAALKAGLGPKHLAKWEKEARRIQDGLAKAKTLEDKQRISLMHKEWKEEFKHVGALAKRRTQALADMGKQMEGRLARVSQNFASGLGGALRDVTSLNLEGMAGQLKKLGAGLGKGGLWMQSKEGTGPMSKMVKLMGKMVKGLGKMAAAGGIAGGVLAMLVAGLMAVANHGAKMNRAMMDSGAVMGDIATEGANVRKTLREVVLAFDDFERNVEWMQTGEEQLKILGAWQAAGHTIKEMSKGIKEATDRQKEYLKAVQTATVYSRLLGMGAEEVATTMAGYMDELGVSLDGIQERFAAVYEVAQASGFGTKRFFGMVLQATSGMAMYNVRLSETAGLLLSLGKMLGQKGGEEMLNQLSGGFKGESTTDLLKRSMKMGAPTTRAIVGAQAESAGKSLVKIMQEQGIGAERATAEMKKRGLKIDFTSSTALVKTMGQLSAKGQVELLKGLKDLVGDQPQVVRQFEKSLDLFRGAVKGTPKALAGALAAGGPTTKLLAELHGVAAVIKTPIEEMSFEQVAAMESMQGISRDQFNQLKSIARHTRAGHEETLALQKEWKALHEEGKNFSKEQKEDQIAKFGAYINDQGKRIAANTPEVLKMSPEERAQYEEANEIGKNLLDFQMSQGEAFMEITKDRLDKQTELSIDIAQNTENLTKVLEIGVESILNDLYGVAQDILAWIQGGNPEEIAARKQAVDLIKEQKKVLSTNLRKEFNELAKTNKALAKLPEDSAKRADLETTRNQQIASTEALKLSIEKLGKMGEIARNIGGVGEFLGIRSPTDWFKDTKDQGDFLAIASRMASEQMPPILKTLEERLPESVVKGLKAKAGGSQKEYLDLLRGMTKGGQVQKVWDQKEKRYVKTLSKTSAGEQASKARYTASLGQAEIADLDASNWRIAVSQGLKSGDAIAQAKAIMAVIGQEGGKGEKIMAGVLAGQKDLPPSLQKELTTEKMAELEALGLTQAAKDRLTQKDMTKLLKKDNPEAFGKQLRKENDRRDQAILRGQLAAAGIGENRGDIAKALLGSGRVGGLAREELLKKGRRALEMGVSGKAAENLARILDRGGVSLGEEADDFIWRPGQKPQRINPADVVTGSKAGGPLAKAGAGGGGRVVHNHFYNDGQGNFNSIRKYERAMGGYA